MQETMAVWKFRVRRHGFVNFWSTYLDVYFLPLLLPEMEWTWDN